MRRVVLNEPPVPAAASAGALAETLASRMLGAFGRATDAAGRVDYRILGASAEFGSAVDAARGLGSVRPDALATREERLAFWINVYNALVLHAIVGLGVR